MFVAVGCSALLTRDRDRDTGAGLSLAVIGTMGWTSRATAASAAVIGVTDGFASVTEACWPADLDVRTAPRAIPTRSVTIPITGVQTWLLVSGSLWPVNSVAARCDGVLVRTSAMTDRTCASVGR